MSSTPLQRKRLAAALYLPAHERTDGCQGCRSATVVKKSITCGASRGGAVAHLGICVKWRPKLGRQVLV